MLVDAGLSGRELERRMARVGISPRKLSAILVSHEHRDHISGVGVLARRYRLPVYINELTLSQCQAALDRVQVKIFETGKDFALGPIKVHPFSVSHDAVTTEWCWAWPRISGSLRTWSRHTWPNATPWSSSPIMTGKCLSTVHTIGN
ncbi:MAG: MBL fold metallo-hydrolase [Deltaproteobacteria bacterium]|nr:MBL fold metallo-hydrolase [Deltaproteobacteria bacterium]